MYTCDLDRSPHSCFKGRQQGVLSLSQGSVGLQEYQQVGDLFPGVVGDGLCQHLGGKEFFSLLLVDVGLQSIFLVML